MKIAVIGSRGFTSYDMLKNELDQYNIDCIISGGAKGADSLAEQYARENNIEIIVHKPDWRRYGRGAGVVRNRDIVSSSDMVIAFWDGQSRGTKNSIELAEKANKPLKVVRYTVS